MQVSFQEGVFICKCRFEDRHIPKQFGFRWNPDKRQWYTSSHGVAARLRDHADEPAKIEMNRVCLTNTPWTGAIPVPKDLALFPFQLEAVKFALARNRSYLALDPGLGKTIVAATLANTLKKPVVYICPPFLVRNVRAEFERWKVESPLLIVPDSVLHKEEMKKTIGFFLNEFPNSILFVDEAHRYKTLSAKRTKTLLKEIVPFFDRISFLSGTPMPNRPMELYPVLSSCAPETIDFMNQFEYGKLYCNAYQHQWGWDFSGVSNVERLAKSVMGKFMLRMKKKDVLKELPPKTEELLFVGGDLPADVNRLDREVLKHFSPTDLMGYLAPNGHIATYRKELGLVKAKHAGEYIAGLLEETDENLLVFAIHKDTIKYLTDHLRVYNPLVVTGDTPMALRQSHVNEFQNDSTKRLFIGNIQAAGTGFTLTKATRVVFAEFSWVPADNDQAADRAHRIGQKDHVYVQYLVFQNSIDRAVMEAILAKRKITAHV